MKTLSLAAALATLAIGAGASGQDLNIPAAPQSRPVLITGATVHTVSGETIENGFVLFDGGLIRTVSGSPISAPAGAETIDASGKHLYPGLINAQTTIGLEEIQAVRPTRDVDETGDLTPEVRAAVAVNPDSWHIPVTRSNGVLTVGVTPEGGVLPGRMSVMRLNGWTWEDLTVLDDAGLILNWPNVRPVRAWWMERSDEEQQKEAREALQKIDDAFSAAEAYMAARAADPDATPYSVRWEAMRPVLTGAKPVIISAQEVDQIRSAVSWATKRGLRCVILGGRDAAICADLLKKHDVGVIITGTLAMPRRDDSAYDEAYLRPMALEEAGVRWCLSGGGATGYGNDRNLPYHAAIAVAHGLPYDSALRGVTLSAAELLGVADRLGSIEPGKSATLVLTDGDILDVTTTVEAAFIDGARIDLSNKQTDLADKYREKYRRQGVTPGH